MPAKNSVKQYAENGYYHIYNRGVAKQPIFLDEQDFAVFLLYLKELLMPPKLPSFEEEHLQLPQPYKRKNFHQEITILCFCLMPNHFHLLLKQKAPRSVVSFMRSLVIRYSQYFNRRYKRVGHVFQDVYKGILVTNDAYLLWLSRYIHRNSLELLGKGKNLVTYSYSSYPHYLGRVQYAWVDSQEILAQVKDYQLFVEDPAQDYNQPKSLANLFLEETEES